jgi:hypothetical protein
MRLGALILAGGMLINLPLIAAPVVAAPRPWKTGDEPPTVNGVKLGDTEQRALDLLGVPDEVNPTSNGELLEYTTKGLEVTATKDGVTAIRLLSRDAGSIDGIRVGDIARAVVLKWGAPQGGSGVEAQFGPGPWVIVVRLAAQDPTIVDLTLALNHVDPALDASKLNTFQTK